MFAALTLPEQNTVLYNYPVKHLSNPARQRGRQLSVQWNLTTIASIILAPISAASFALMQLSRSFQHCRWKDQSRSAVQIFY